MSQIPTFRQTEGQKVPNFFKKDDICMNFPMHPFKKAVKTEIVYYLKGNQNLAFISH